MNNWDVLGTRTAHLIGTFLTTKHIPTENTIMADLEELGNGGGGGLGVDVSTRTVSYTVDKGIRAAHKQTNF